MTFTLSVLNVLIAVTAVLAIIDGIQRLRSRGNNTLLAVLELVFSIALGLTFFVALPLGILTIAVVLEVVLVVTLVAGGKGRKLLTLIATITNGVLILASIGWLTIPGFI
jgi:hypothetical protein